MKKLIETTEHSSIQLQYKLNRQERAYLYKLACKNNDQQRTYRFHFEEYGNQLSLKTLSWVGVIELEAIRIEIRPKFDRGFTSLVDLICFVNRIPFYKWHDTSAVYARDDFMELLMQLFLVELEKLMQHGLVKEYVAEEDNLRQLRGRPFFNENLKKNQSKPTRIFCGYDELVTNVPENQIVLAALELTYRFRLKQNTKRQLNMYRCEFEKVCEPYIDTNWPVLYYHRLNAHYEKVHRLCVYILKCSSVSEVFNYQQQSFFSLLIDMNEIFEMFLAELLTRYLPKHYKLEAGKRIRNAVMRNGKFYREIIPDLVLTDLKNGGMTVIDAKYKPYGERPVDTSDIFQVSFYAQYFNRDLKSGHQSIIVYPLYPGEGKSRFFIDLLLHSPYCGSVKVEGISIEKIIESVKDKQVSYLKEKARGLISIYKEDPILGFKQN